MDKQHTIVQSFSLEGIGLHTGEFITCTVHPAEPNAGIKFRRTDLVDQPIIPADVDLVMDTNRCTALN
jgi:UDP-3-O-[3-hydroxymyristoyl] N-acetylglucosamine deacetylase/3-hydroxyacyl-[acyl-carrier-protein] dehydratase